ncbi:hypothetical protein [Paraliomyxa miuraensis]|uniref:hypothetical protein n=1 Tax=Paraliomyxa miuraensis TaxID=376150 RepID=UPI00224EA8F9|nr:hypothetical protein [Paraliomyxa miuraensis]MCX4247975.1 hypothetical protein [Paraliomyxa miuraensis]
MITRAILACLAGTIVGLGMTWAPTTAQANLTTPPQLGARDCGYNNLFCEADGSNSCIVCGSGWDITCYEDRTTCPDLTI